MCLVGMMVVGQKYHVNYHNGNIMKFEHKEHIEFLNKPDFKEGDRVTFTLPGTEGTGTIRGLVSENIVDIWIVETDEPFPEYMYSYSCFAIPHVYLKKLDE